MYTTQTLRKMEDILTKLKKEVEVTAKVLGEPEDHIYCELIGFCVGRRTGKIVELYKKSKGGK